MESTLPILSALWLGILCSISPCPLATNIAAVSYVSHRLAHKRIVLLSGLLYTLGRSLVYIALAILTVKALANMPVISNFLQQYMSKVVGFLLVAAGVLLLEIWTPNLPGLSTPESVHKKLGDGGLAGSFLLGGLFALALCPVSAAMFFGGLIPLTVQSKSAFALPLLFGVGTAMPVLVFSTIVITGAPYLDKVYRQTAKLERYARRGTGIVFILIGLYYISAYVLEFI